MQTGHGIREAIARRDRSAEEVTRAALDAIDRVEPSLRAYITLLPERALANAPQRSGDSFAVPKVIE